MSSTTGSSTNSHFNFDQVHTNLGKISDALDAELKNKVAAMDPNSTKDVVEFQIDFNKYMIIEGLRSSIIKSIKDTIQGIVQKI